MLRLVKISDARAGDIGRLEVSADRLAEKAIHLLRYGFLIWRTEHTGCIDAVLLGELAGARGIPRWSRMFCMASKMF